MTFIGVSVTSYMHGSLNIYTLLISATHRIGQIDLHWDVALAKARHFLMEPPWNFVFLRALGGRVRVRD